MAKRRRYTKEFKDEAVRLVEDEDMSYADVGRSLDVHPSTVRSWYLDACGEAASMDSRAKPLQESEAQELSRLRKEVRRLREEKEILKKAAAFFATESR